jgi:hypothetical protein
VEVIEPPEQFVVVPVLAFERASSPEQALCRRLPLGAVCHHRRLNCCKNRLGPSTSKIMPRCSILSNYGEVPPHAAAVLPQAPSAVHPPICGPDRLQLESIPVNTGQPRAFGLRDPCFLCFTFRSFHHIETLAV